MIPFVHNNSNSKFRFCEGSPPAPSSKPWTFSFSWTTSTGYPKIDTKTEPVVVFVICVGFFMYVGVPNQPRVIGDYILGPRIGSGSFAVVWHSRHRCSGLEFAVKEIDKKQLSQKVRENLLKEISILSTIDHPNVIRLFEAIQVMSCRLSLLFFFFLIHFSVVMLLNVMLNCGILDPW